MACRAVFWCWLFCPALVLMLWLLAILLADVAVLGLVNHPLHMVDAPVECFVANLFLFWLIFFWWNLFPLLILLLKAFV